MVLASPTRRSRSEADVRSFTTDAGVDVVSFGGTKNGMMYGEAVVFLNPSVASSARFIRKQSTQLPSKARFIAAQFLAMFDDDLWLQTAAHANAMAVELHASVAAIVDAGPRPPVNAVFPTLPRSVITDLQTRWRFYDWNVHANQVRWMTSWDTTDDDIAAFAADVEATVTRLA